MNRGRDAKKNMKIVAKWNGTYDQILWRDFDFETPTNIHQHKKIEEIWRAPDTKKNLRILMINWFGIIFCFYTMGFLLKYLSGNIYTNTRFATTADVLGILILGMYYL
jgi:hypothetical protein